MAFVFKPVVTGRKNGHKTRRRSRYYWAKYRDLDGREVRRVLVLPSGGRIADKEVAQQALRTLLRQLERRAVGLVDPLTESARLPMRKVLADFIRHLRAKRLLSH